MKKILFLLLITITTNVFSQTGKDSVYIIQTIDEMDGTIYLVPNRNYVLHNDTNTKGFSIDLFITADEKASMICSTRIGIGNTCSEKDEMIILFANNEHLKLINWKKYNCDGEMYFDISKNHINLFRTQEIIKIRITNKTSFDSFTGIVPPKDRRYFIQALYALDHKSYITLE